MMIYAPRIDGGTRFIGFRVVFANSNGKGYENHAMADLVGSQAELNLVPNCSNIRIQLHSNSLAFLKSGKKKLHSEQAFRVKSHGGVIL